VFTLAEVDAYATSLAGVTVGESWGRKTWLVNGKGFVWDRPLTKADIKRYGDAELPQGEILGVRVENLDAKDALLSIAPPGFFTIPHFNGYPGLLIELRLAQADDVRRAISDAWTTVSAKKAKGTAKRVVSSAKKPATKKAAMKSTAKKAATKKAATMKPTTKKTATKKAAAKKATAKKATAIPRTKVTSAKRKRARASKN
jgi:hypothetical protein